jgi:hypothetical protein
MNDQNYDSFADSLHGDKKLKTFKDKFDKSSHQHDDLVNCDNQSIDSKSVLQNQEARPLITELDTS